MSFSNVLPGRTLRSRWIVGRNCGHDRRMLFPGGVGATGQRHGGHSQQRHRIAQHIEGFQQIPVMGRTVDRAVKLPVMGRDLLRVGGTAFVGCDQILKNADLCLRGVPCRQPRSGTLKDLAHLVEFHDRLMIQL